MLRCLGRFANRLPISKRPVSSTVVAKVAIKILRMARATASLSPARRVPTPNATKSARYAKTSKGAKQSDEQSEGKTVGTLKPRSADYLKIAEWSEEDGCYVGSAPPLIGPSCHGSNQIEVYKEICEIVEEWLEIMERDGIPVPPPSAQKTYSGKFNLRTGPDLHKTLEIRALQAGESLNTYCVRELTKAVTIRRPSKDQSVRSGSTFSR